MHKHVAWWYKINIFGLCSCVWCYNKRRKYKSVVARLIYYTINIRHHQLNDMKTKRIQQRSHSLLPLLGGNLLLVQHHDDNLHKHFILLCGSFVFSTASLSSIATQTLFCTILSNIRIDFVVSLISWITNFHKVSYYHKFGCSVLEMYTMEYTSPFLRKFHKYFTVTLHSERRPTMSI